MVHVLKQAQAISYLFRNPLVPWIAFKRSFTLKHCSS